MLLNSFLPSRTPLSSLSLITPCLSNGILPPPLWIKLNIDRAHNQINHGIAVGGIARDYLGNCIKGFYKFMGCGTSLLVETWAAVLGIKMLDELNYNYVWIEFDCLTLVNLLNNMNLDAGHHLAPLIFKCRSCLSSFQSFKISHVHRGGNQCVDSLAGKALLEGGDYSFDHSFPTFLSQAFLGDLFGIPTPRRVGVG